MKTMARVNMMGLGCGDGATAITPTTLTLPPVPTLSQSPASNPSDDNDTGSLCTFVDWVANNQVSTLIIVGVATWIFSSVTKRGR
jgi:hypothetical protein